MKKLEDLLLNLPEFLDENSKILKGKVKEYAIKHDEKLLNLLLESSFKDLFFKKLKNGVLVFEYKKFIDYIDDKNFLLDSYTKFSNKIGLSVSDKHLRQSSDVVLSFPFKDCVLKGDQSKDEEKSREIFFNETLARDEINRLFDKKALVNFKKFNSQQSTVNSQQSTVNSQQSTVNSQQSTVNS